MVGRLRQSDGLSDKAQGCCLKCCEVMCRVSPWNKVICYSVILLVLATLIMIFGGAFITVSSNDLAGIGSNICARDGTDIIIPQPINKNIYVWYLTNTGIIVTVLIAMTAVCCFSYVGLCCGLNLPKLVKIIAVVGFILLGVGMLIFVAWLVIGGWLISTMGGTNITFSSICRRIVTYVIFMLMYIVVVVGVLIATCVWSIHGSGEDESTKARPSKKSKLKKPPMMPI